MVNSRHRETDLRRNLNRFTTSQSHHIFGCARANRRGASKETKRETAGAVMGVLRYIGVGVGFLIDRLRLGHWIISYRNFHRARGDVTVYVELEAKNKKIILSSRSC
jgi:hypothetical protein